VLLLVFRAELRVVAQQALLLLKERLKLLVALFFPGIEPTDGQSVQVDLVVAPLLRLEQSAQVDLVSSVEDVWILSSKVEELLAKALGHLRECT